jgi:phosphoglycerate dehydrogenase-like enzyme
VSRSAAPVRAHLLRTREEEHLAHLRARLKSGVEVSVGEHLPQPADHEILVAGRPRREHIEASPNLSALVIPFAGVPAETRELMLQFPVVSVHNLHHNALATAEMAVTLMLAAAKAIIPSDRALRQHDWRPRYRSNPSVLLGGKTALVLGYGAVGRRVGQLCRGLGMHVLATRRSATESSDGFVHPPSAMSALLPRADVLLVTLPLTEETRGLLGQDELELLPPGAILVNVGRAAVADEAALYAALRSGKLRAAGLDVWYQYPSDVASRSDTRPSSYPFEDLENVVMSPHRAGAGGSDEIERRRMAALASVLNAAAAGDPLPNQVDLQAGY